MEGIFFDKFTFTFSVHKHWGNEYEPGCRGRCRWWRPNRWQEWREGSVQFGTSLSGTGEGKLVRKPTSKILLWILLWMRKWEQENDLKRSLTSPRDLPETIVNLKIYGLMAVNDRSSWFADKVIFHKRSWETNLAEASSMTKAIQEATKRDQERERPYSAPALRKKVFSWKCIQKHYIRQSIFCAGPPVQSNLSAQEAIWVR